MIMAAVVYLSVLFTFGGYLAYCAIWASKRSGKLARMPLLLRLVVLNILAVALVLDFLFNALVGSVAFLELIELRRPLFTHRCKKWMASMTWRGRLARWVCEGWLNPFQDNHC